MWEFWIDRGGTFTDVIARYDSGQLLVKKVLSENLDLYKDPAIEGIRQFLGIKKSSKIPLKDIKSIRMGTTVATNALLERKGEPVVLITTSGLEHQLRIAYRTDHICLIGILDCLQNYMRKWFQFQREFVQMVL